MTKKTYIGVMVVALAVALTAGTLIASNMGFKLNYGLNATQGGVSKSGTNTLALSDNRQTGLGDAKNLMDDIGFNSVNSVQKFIKSTDGLQNYTGRKGGGTAFPLNAGEGNFVKMSQTVNYIVVGSDDPTLAYALNKAVAQTPQVDQGQNLFAYNYHQTAADAKALMDDIGSANVIEIDKYIKASNSFQAYTGRKGGGTAFALTPGEAYFVKMSTSVNYTPSHY